MTTNKELEPGDKCHHVTGGPQMVVANITKGGSIKCTWFIRGHKFTESFEACELEASASTAYNIDAVAPNSFIVEALE